MSEGSFVQGDEVPRFSMNHERCFSEEARLAKPGSQNLKLYLFNNNFKDFFYMYLFNNK